MGKCASAPEEVKPIYDIATESCGSPSTPKSRSKSRNSPRTQDADAITWIRGYSAAQESNQSIVQLDEIDDVDREETRSQIAIEPNLQFGDVAPIPQLQAGDETGFIFLQTSVSNSRRSLTGRSAQSPQGTPTMKLNTSNASLRHQTSNSVSSTWKFNLSPYAMKSRSALFEADEPSASQLCEDDDIYIPPDEEMTFGDEVELSADLNSLRGIIRFFGHVPLRKGESFNPMNSSFYGIQLFKPRGSDDVVFFRKKCNKMNGFPQTQNSGLFGEIRYFECGPNEGWFVRKEQIARVLKVNYDNPRVSCGIPIYLKQFDSMGIIRYVGRPEIEPKSDRSTQNNTKYGIELLDFNGFRRSKTDEMDRNPGSCPDANPDAIRESERDSDRAPNRESDENPNPDPYPDPDSFQFTDGTLCGQKCFHCVSDYGVFLEASDLSVFVQPSRYNLLVHGYILMKCRESMRIPSGIIRLIQSYGDQMQLRLTGIIEITPSDAALGERVLKYESFNICNNICGPPITIRKSGSHTHSSRYDTTISGHYRFTKSKTVDFGDYNTKLVTMKEELIFKLDEGSAKNIFRSMDCDNEVPLFGKTYESIRQRWRHDVHRRDKDECDHSEIIDHISKLYHVTTKEIMDQFNLLNIQLYGLKVY